MTCDEVRERLDAYFDGELGEAEAVGMAQALEGCPSCQSDLRDLAALRAMAEAAFVEPVRNADLSGFADGVMQRIGALAAGSEPVDEAGGGTSWLAQLLSLDRPRLAWAGAMVAALVVAGVLWFAPESTTPEATGPDHATPSTVATAPKASSPTPRRGRELETAPTGLHAATVESFEVAHGRVIIDDNADDPDRPMVVWHLEEEPANPEMEPDP